MKIMINIVDLFEYGREDGLKIKYTQKFKRFMSGVVNDFTFYSIQHRY